MALTALCLLLAIAPAQDSRAQGRIAASTTPDWAAPHVPGQLLIKFNATSPAAAATLAAQTGLAVQDTIPQLGIAVLAMPEAGTNAELAATAAALEASPAVEWAEPNYTFTLDATPNDPDYLTNQAPYLNRLEMPAAWDYTTGHSDIIIAVLDTGVSTDHPDLTSGIWTNSKEFSGYGGIDDDGNGFIDDVHGWNFPDGNNQIYDDYGHGTHVAGIAAARINNGVGIAGMAGGATIMPVDVFNYAIGTYEDLIRAIIYATDNGADVINMSLGASSYSRGEQMAVDYAWSHNVVVVAAAGNTGQETYHYPAAHANVIAVAATSATDSLCGFSTRGNFVDVAAPGCSVWSSVPGGYGWKQGTSMAAPHVAGLAALILSLNPILTPEEVRALIESGADDLGAPGWDTSFGVGRINARSTLAKVTPAVGPTPPPPPPLSIWPAGCRDLVMDGDFENGLAAWRAGGNARVDATQAYTGVQALHFPGGPAAFGVVSRTITLPSAPTEGMLWFAYRIETQDWGYGTSPQVPYDDWLTVDFRMRDGQQLVSLLRSGNTADTSSSGLPWDRYVYRMQTVDFAPLHGVGPVDLVFTAQNDGDTLPTSFWIDGVRLCVTWGDLSQRSYLPLMLNAVSAPSPTR
jgi:thermitase